MTVTGDDIRAAQAGDRDAFERLYREHNAALRKFAARRIQPAHLAEDIAAETWARAVRHLARYQEQGKLRAFLFTIARNLILDHYKHAEQARRATDFQVYVAAIRGELVPDSETHGRTAIDFIDGSATDPADIAAARDQFDRVLAAMRSLTEQQQRVIELRYLAELSVRETQQLMGINEGAVKALQFRATASLRRALGVEVVAA